MLGAARIAGIMAAKRTHELIPLCHPLALSQGRGRHRAGPQAARPRRCARPCKVTGQTGVEMEALTAVVGRLPHDLRHGEGGRARHAHRGHPPGREARRQIRHLSGERSADMALLPVADALAQVLRRRRRRCRLEQVAARRSRRPRARRGPRGAAHAAAGRRLGDGRLCGARRRRRERARAPARDRRGRGRPAVRRRRRRRRGRAHLHRRRAAGRRRHGGDPGADRARRRHDRRRRRPRRAARTCAAPGSISARATCGWRRAAASPAATSRSPPR